MNKKLIVLVVVCLLFAAACAHPFRKPSFRRHKNAEKKPVERSTLPLPKKPDFMFPGKLRDTEFEKALGTTQKHQQANHEHHHQHQHQHQHPHKFGCDKGKNKDKDGNNGNKMKESVTLVPGKLTEAVINWGTRFTVEVTTGDALAVQIVHSSTKYTSENGVKPELSLCRVDSRNCVTEKNHTLSFELDASAVNSFLGGKTKGNFNFILTTSRSRVSGVVANLYACVGKNATLQKCVTPVVVGCVNGRQDKNINVCICDDGYTGKRCDQKATKAPNVFEYDEDFEGVFRLFGALIAIFVNIIFYVVVFVLITCCCVCLRACCQRRRTNRANRGSVVNNRTFVPQPVAHPQPIIPPPMYPPGGYRPLTAPPPPPPPPPSVTIVQPMPVPQPQRPHRYDPYAAEGIEMSTMPAKPTNTVYVMPPLAPVKQVPVYIQPPAAPKN